MSLQSVALCAKHGNRQVGIGVFAVDRRATIGLFEYAYSDEDARILFHYQKLIAFVGSGSEDIQLTRIHRGWLMSTFSVVDPSGVLEMTIRNSNKVADILHNALAGNLTLGN